MYTTVPYTFYISEEAQLIQEYKFYLELIFQ